MYIYNIIPKHAETLEPATAPTMFQATYITRLVNRLETLSSNYTIERENDRKNKNNNNNDNSDIEMSSRVFRTKWPQPLI